MPYDPHFGVHYYSKRLLENEKRMEPYRQRLYEIPIVPFTIEEHILIREILMDYSSLTRLLAENVSPLPKRTPKKFWFDKYIDQFR